MSEFVPCTPAGLAYWSQVTSLDGTAFVLSFSWSQREGHWSLDLADADGTVIRVGMLLVAGVPLLRGCAVDGRPAGELVVVDTTGGNDVDPAFADLGSPGARFVLMYVTAAELAA